MNIIMISASCCMPSMVNTDNAARKIINDALFVAGVQAEFKVIKATKAYGSVAFHDVMKKGKGMSDAPVILINGKVISFGIPKLDDLKKALIKFDEKSKGGLKK